MTQKSCAVQGDTTSYEIVRLKLSSQSQKWTNILTSEASVRLRSTDDKATRRIDMVDGVFIKEVGWNDLTNNMLHDLWSQALKGHVLIVLDGNDNGVYTERDAGTLILQVFNCDLGKYKETTVTRSLILIQTID